MRLDMCLDMCVDMCFDMCFDTCLDMLLDMCLGLVLGHVSRHVFRHVLRRVLMHVLRHVLSEESLVLAVLGGSPHWPWPRQLPTPRVPSNGSPQRHSLRMLLSHISPLHIYVSLRTIRFNHT